MGKPAFVIKKLGIIEIRTIHVGRGALGNGPEVGSEGLWIVLLDSLIALPQGFLDDAGDRLSGGFSDGLGKPAGFRVFDVEAHGASFLLYHFSTLSSFPDSGPGAIRAQDLPLVRHSPPRECRGAAGR